MAPAFLARRDVMAEGASNQAGTSGTGGAERKTDPAIERLQIYVGLAKFLIGTVALGAITLAFNQQYRNAQLDLEEKKNEHALQLQEKQAEVEYLSKFVNEAMRKDIKDRVDFADYMKSVALSKTLQEIWSKYYAVLNERAKEAQEKIKELDGQKQEVAKQLAAVEFAKANQPDTKELVDQLQRIYSNLYSTQAALDEKQYGSFKENFFDFRSVAADATAARRAGNYQRERDFLLGAVENAPKDVKPYFLARLTGAYRSLHDFSNARRAAEEAVDLAPTADSLYRLAIMQKNDNWLDLALNSLSKAADLSQGQERTQIELVTAGYLIHNGQRDEGLRRFEALQPKLQPRDDFIGNIAWFNAVADRKEEFYKALERSLEVNRDATLQWIVQEVDIDRFRNKERFKQLVSRARAG
jgi:hypothetical protein